MKFLKSILILLILLIPVMGCAQSGGESDITVKQLMERMNSDTSLVILDVRTPAELTGPLGKLDSVINIPVQILGERISELEKYKSKPIIVICRSGNRSTFATKMLRKNGFDALNVLGGMKAWNAEFK